VPRGTLIGFPGLFLAGVRVPSTTHRDARDRRNPPRSRGVNPHSRLPPFLLLAGLTTARMMQ
jgi:hypothetical protein